MTLAHGRLTIFSTHLATIVTMQEIVHPLRNLGSFLVAVDGRIGKKLELKVFEERTI